MSPRFFIIFSFLNLCLSEGEHFLESLEDLQHLGLSVTDLLEIQQLADTISDQELETMAQVLENLSEEQVLELSDKTEEELDLLFRAQLKQETRSKRSPFGLSLTANIRTQHIASQGQGWFPAPPPPPPYGFPFAGQYHHQNHHFAGSSYYGVGGPGPVFSHGGRYGRSSGEDDN